MWILKGTGKENHQRLLKRGEGESWDVCRPVIEDKVEFKMHLRLRKVERM